jgi:AcrR family transcriptional regulator
MFHDHVGNRSYHHGDLKNALIEAGVQILAAQGVGGLSLRKVAGRAGVSRTAPYAHFADKQALIAAISTEGYRRLYQKMKAVVEKNAGQPARQLVEIGRAYIDYAIKDPDRFKITFSGVIEKEKSYQDLVEISHATFRLLIETTKACQSARILKSGPVEMTAIGVWSIVHGFVCLLLENQIPRSIMKKLNTRETALFLLTRIVGADLRPPRSRRA